MKLQSLILLGLVFNSLGAQALENPVEEKVEAKSLVLVGKGFADSKSTVGESIALACSNADCSELRFVYFETRQKASFVGDKIKAPSAPTPELKQKAIELVTKEYFYTHQSRTSAQAIDDSILNTGYLILATAAGAALAIPTFGTSLLAMGTTGGITLGAMLLFSSADAMNSVTQGGMSTATLSDQDGWSWVNQPQKVKSIVFGALLFRIENGQHLMKFTEQVYGSWDRDNKMADQILRKKRRLERKGVVFQDNYWGY